MREKWMKLTFCKIDVADAAQPIACPFIDFDFASFFQVDQEMTFKDEKEGQTFEST